MIRSREIQEAGSVMQDNLNVLDVECSRSRDPNISKESSATELNFLKKSSSDSLSLFDLSHESNKDDIYALLDKLEDESKENDGVFT